MVRRRPRPPVGWLVAAAVLGWYAIPSVLAAGILTALVAAVFQPSELVWMTLFVTLSVAFALLGLRQYAPQWYAWLLGRLPHRPYSN
jgi:hypothetical protein